MSTQRHEALLQFSYDHHHGLVMSHRLQRYVQQYGSNASVVIELGRVIVGFFDKELADHFKQEEEILFPAMEVELGDLPVIAELREERTRLRSLVEWMRTHQSGVSVDDIRSFADLLESHIRKEERVLFKTFEEQIPAETAEKLAAQLKHDKLLTNAHTRRISQWD